MIDRIILVKFGEHTTGDQAALVAYGPNPHHQAVAALIREYGRVDSIAANMTV